MSLVRCQFLSDKFRPGVEGIFLNGNGIVPSMAYDWQEMVFYIADHVYHYTELDEVAYKPEFQKRLKEIDGMRIMDIPDEQWERLDIYAEFTARESASKRLLELEDPSQMVAVSDLPLGTVISFSDGVSSTLSLVVDRDVLDGEWLYAINVPTTASPLRTLYQYTIGLMLPTSDTRTVWVDSQSLRPGGDGTFTVVSYVPPDMWALVDNALVLGCSLAMAATTWAAGGGPISMLPMFAFSVYDPTGRRYYNLLDTLKAWTSGSYTTGNALAGGWTRYGIMKLGDTMGLIDARAAGMSVSHSRIFGSSMVLGALGSTSVFLYNQGPALYNSMTSYWTARLPNLVEGLQSLFVRGAEGAGEFVVGTASTLGRGVGAATTGFRKEDPVSAGAIGSVFKGGGITVALVVGTMLAMSVYNYLPKKRARRPG